ncbi:uncharacterized protein METZ01_LOCUS70120 [marine metagenome]|uniref:Uncharacterized protein n=1 Tax=marine metagenome TaxID=408172 RepID=A0A381TMG1_9ZZZZ|tara:strand:+ start:321 stop:695 length:375 start_codon:yes stop_codon:yes gene_type:complete
MFLSDFKPNFKKKIRDLHFKLSYLYNSDKKIGEQNKIDHDSRSIVQNRFKLIIITDVLNYRENLYDDDFFFFKHNKLPRYELSKLHLTQNVYENLALHDKCYVFYYNFGEGIYRKSEWGQLTHS